ncbi:MAG: phosphotransferase [Planctomyces sp.]|nr:phosphotransferase [Planctomyces sp.]
MDTFLEITADNVVDYLISRQHLGAGERVTAETLAWGVSNIVIRIHHESAADFVVKQSRAQLRTKAVWLSNLNRIWREAEVMRELGTLLPAGVVPQVLFEDRENYLFAMEAIDPDHRVWKADLLDGQFDPSIAGRLGTFLATIHARTWKNPEYEKRWGDWEVFDQLRIDPFYRYLVGSYPNLKNWIADFIEEIEAHPLCLVLADFSPKNILISRKGIHLVDFETAHFGDPAFDLGFFLSHLLLKTIHHGTRGMVCLQLADQFWREYRRQLADQGESLAGAELDRRSIKHLAACMLARVDGKSPVDYITEPHVKDQVRSFALSLIQQPPESMTDAFERLAAVQKLKT